MIFLTRDLKSLKEVIDVTNTLELEIAIKKSSFTKREIAKRMKISEMGFYKKLNNITEFKASEISKLVEILNISNVGSIFFDQEGDLKSLVLKDTHGI